MWEKRWDFVIADTFFFLLQCSQIKSFNDNAFVSFNWKRSVFIPFPKKGSDKECSNYHTIAFISHARKVMLKTLRARLQQYVNWEFPDVPAGFRKGRGNRDQIANIHWIIEKAMEFQKNIHFCFIDYAKSLWLWKILKRHGNTRTPYLSPEKPICGSRSNSQNGTWNNRMVQNWERSMSRLYTVTLLI